MDFSAAYLLPTKPISCCTEFFNKDSIMDLVVVVIYRKESEKDLQFSYFDYLAANEKHDTLYVRHSFKHMFSTTTLLNKFFQDLLVE